MLEVFKRFDSSGWLKILKLRIVDKKNSFQVEIWAEFYPIRYENYKKKDSFFFLKLK